MRVAVVAEYYPRAADPALGIWAHRQAVAARDAGADVRVLVLHRLVPPRAALAGRDREALLAPLRQPRRAELDGIPIAYVPFVAPDRDRSYGSWSAWAAPGLAGALGGLRRRWRYDLVHAHYAAPAGDAALRARASAPVVVSVHGGDVLAVPQRWPGAGGRAVRRALGGARLVLANSAGIEARCHALGAGRTRVVHLGADLPPRPASPPESPTLVTVANLVERKRHADVLQAVAHLPGVRWEVVGDGPERFRLETRAEALGVADRVRFRGRLTPAAAVAVAQQATLFVLPSVDEAFGVAYVEAMAAGVPAVGCRGEPGPEELARCGDGIALVPPRDPAALTATLRALLASDLRRMRHDARDTVRRSFTWAACGEATLDAYRTALA